MMVNNFPAMSLFAHHKGGGSTVNGRSSAGRRPGTERADGQTINAGSIIYRQHGTKIHPGKNAGIDGDDTLFALMSGVIRFECLNKTGKQVSIYPVEEAE